MAFTVVGTGNTIQAAHVTEIQDALSGTSGASQLIKITAVNDASNWALDVRNLDSTNSRGLRVRDSDSATIALLAGASVTLGKKLVMTGLGTYTASANMVDIAATWNLTAGTFKAIQVDITNTASAAASRLLDLQVGSSSKFSVDVSGKLIMTGLGTYTASANMLDIAATWNLTAGVFKAINVVITNTDSHANSRLLDLQTSVSSRFSVNVAGNVLAAGTLTVDGTSYIGDTTNTDVTLGLTINQAANTNQILALKQSAVNHLMTTNAETDTFGAFTPVATTGGVALTGYTGATLGAQIAGVGVTDVTGKATTVLGYISIYAAKRTGTTFTNTGADANLVVIRNYTTTRFIFDAEGSAHADVEWTTYDDYDDVLLLGDFERAMLAQRDSVKKGFADFLKYNRGDLEQAKIVHFDRDNPGHAMVNQTRLGMLMIGAIQQLSARLERQAGELQTLRQALLPANG